MKNDRLRFALLVPFAITSALLASGFVACDSDSHSPVIPSLDAASIDAPVTVTDSSLEEDTAIETPVDSGVDAIAPVSADIATDFSVSANPNGAWSYGYVPGDPAVDAGALVLFSAVSNATPNIPAWYDPANSVLGAPAAWRNDSAVTNTSIAPGEFAVHPGNAGEYAVVRWTAPAAGVYSVALQFKTGDTGDTNGLLLHDGVVLVTDDSTSAETVHQLDVTLAAGSHLDVAVGGKGDFYFDSTPIHLTIRSASSN